MQDATINHALAELRARMIRDSLPGLEHVEALLQLRGQQLARVPRKVPHAFKRNGLGRAVIRALRHGPQRLRDIAKRVQTERPELPFDRVRIGVALCLSRLEARGIVRHRGRAWWFPN